MNGHQMMLAAPGADAFDITFFPILTDIFLIVWFAHGPGFLALLGFS
jgi:hypothetical protein